MTWCVVFTKPQKETFAQQRLNEQGFTTYLPESQVEKIIRHQRKVISQPHFPRYLFIQCNPHFEAKQHVIKNTPGISAMLKVGEQLIRVSNDVIRALQVTLEELNKNYQFMFTAGDVVEILEGPFKNQTAIFLTDDAEQRAVLLIEFIMQTVTKISINKTSLKKR